MYSFAGKFPFVGRTIGAIVSSKTANGSLNEARQCDGGGGFGILRNSNKIQSLSSFEQYEETCVFQMNVSIA